MADHIPEFGKMVLVPVDPTTEMIEAHYRAHAEADTVLADAQAVWAAMLSAAPQPSLEGEVGEISKLLIRRDGEEFDGEVHLSSIEGARIYTLLQSLSADNARLREEEVRHNLSFDLRWKSDMRAIERWQQATGRTMTMPDHTDLSVWLFGQLEAAEARLSEAVEVLKRIENKVGAYWAVHPDVSGRPSSRALTDIESMTRQFLSQGGGNG